MASERTANARFNTSGEPASDAGNAGRRDGAEGSPSANSASQAGVTLPEGEQTTVTFWVNRMLEAVAETSPPNGPTTHARAYGIVGEAMYDAYAAYAQDPTGSQLGDALQRPASEQTTANQAVAVSYTAYQALIELFPQDTQVAALRGAMRTLGLDPERAGADPSEAAGIGRIAAEAVLAERRLGGANQGVFSKSKPEQDTGHNPHGAVVLSPLFVPRR